MKQLTMFKVPKKDVVKLDPLAQFIEEFLVEYHFGEDNGISMSDLAMFFNITTRVVRRQITEIRLYGTYYIVGSVKGYYAVDRDEYVDRKMTNKTVNSMKRLVKINPDLIYLLYSELNEIKKELQE